MTLPRRRSGFTLIELLVVIAIIAVLIGLLLPAIQKVREAADRSRCQNNLKQMGVAIHAFHDTRMYFPAGSVSDSPPYGTGGSWGANWMVWILPFMEQGPLFSRMVFAGASGWGPTTNPGAASNIMISTYRCPSSPLPSTAISNPPGGTNVMYATYVGIAGAVNGLIPGYTETRQHTPNPATPGCCSGGIISGGGVMIPGNATPIKLSVMKDGTSNSLMLSEQSDFLVTQDGTSRAWNASGYHGWLIGWHTTQTPPYYGNNGDNRAFGTTTVRYQINATGPTASVLWTNSPGDCGNHGVCDNMGNNIPINSPHPGGVGVAMADGSVKFLRDTLPLATLARLATRDDRQPIGDY